MGMISFTHLNKPSKGGKGVQDAVKNTDIETMKLVELKDYALEIGCDLAEIKNIAQAKKMIKDFLIAKENNEPKSDEQGGEPSNSTDEGQDDEKNDNSGDEADADNSQEDVESK